MIFHAAMEFSTELQHELRKHPKMKQRSTTLTFSTCLSSHTLSLSLHIIFHSNIYDMPSGYSNQYAIEIIHKQLQFNETSWFSEIHNKHNVINKHEKHTFYSIAKYLCCVCLRRNLIETHVRPYFFCFNPCVHSKAVRWSSESLKSW